MSLAVLGIVWPARPFLVNTGGARGRNVTHNIHTHYI